MSAEADIYPLQAPELADRIDGAIGEAGSFTRPIGYYAQAWSRNGRTAARLIDRVHRAERRDQPARGRLPRPAVTCSASAAAGAT